MFNVSAFISIFLLGCYYTMLVKLYGSFNLYAILRQSFILNWNVSTINLCVAVFHLKKRAKLLIS